MTVAPNLIGRAGKLGDVDHLGALEHVLQFDDAALVMGLGFLGRMIFGVFRQVAVRARLRDRLDDARALHLLAGLKLRLQSRVAGDGDGKPIHIVVPPYEFKMSRRSAAVGRQAK